ncbi:hypothetical protein CCAX7_65520 [Capsulimonas corticalis]|uniref:Uncharacterized protein n=1 Tax=Capsulimonas corticalis TaxID=2219043 RepID=A0A402CR26_9BACT|nr:zf-HC2 domain-containing protein [Capsulimonas corticalis]BDI34501.1 hypothetical protein CCAX7_65520 [Capsulimonas corticalis]
MNCTQAELWIQQSLDGMLSAAERESLDAHVAACPACAARWREYRQLSRAATQWVQQPAAISDDFTARLMAQVEARASAPSPARPAPWLQAAAIAAFAGSLAAVVWFARPALQGIRLTTGDIAPDPRVLQTTPSWLLDSARGFSGSLTHLQGAVPMFAWVLPVCLLALAANLVLAHHARRRTA